MAAVRQFSDMQQHWAEACVSRLASLNQITGYPDNTFRPQAKVTRAEFAVFMLNGFPNLPSAFLDPQPTANFKDLPRQHWAYQVLQTAYRKGIYVGYPDNTIRPDKTITREEAIATLANLLIKTYTGTYQGARVFPRFSGNAEILTDLFTDITQASFTTLTDVNPIARWAKPALEAAAAGFLIIDYPTGKQLRPTQAITRAEVAASLCQAQEFYGLVPVEAVAGNQHFDWSPELKKLQRAKTDGQWGWFDRKRQITAIVAPLAKPTEESIVELGELAENRVSVLVKGVDGRSRYGYVNEKGEWAIAPQFETAANFSGGLAAISENLKYGFIDAQGKRVIPLQFDEVKSFSEGLAAVRINSQWGFIDLSGAWAVPLQAHNVEPFSDGLARIEAIESSLVNNRYGFIDRTGKPVIPFTLTQVNSFSEGLAWATKARIDQPDERGYIDRMGQWAISVGAEDWGNSFSDGLALLATAGLPLPDPNNPLSRRGIGFIDRTGKIVIEPQEQFYFEGFDADSGVSSAGVERFVEGVAIARVGLQAGFINRKKAFVISPKYSKVTEVKDGYAYVNYGGTWSPIFEERPTLLKRLHGGQWGYIKIPKQDS